MVWGELTFVAFAVGAISLFLRWLWPTVPRYVASGGLGASLCCAVFSQIEIPSLLFGSLALNSAFIGIGIDIIIRKLSQNYKDLKTPSTLPKEDKSAQRRKLISSCREMIAHFHTEKEYTSFIKFLNTQMPWQEIRPHLDAKALRNLESPYMLVVTKNDVKDGKVYYLRDELDRLEREWELV